MMVHFAIGFTVMGTFSALLEITSERDLFKKFAPISKVMLIIGLAFSWFAIGTGLLTTVVETNAIHQAVENHKTIAFVFVVLSTLIALSKFFSFLHTNTYFKPLMMLLYVGQLSLLVWVGLLGSELVFSHGVNVEPLHKHQREQMQMELDSNIHWSTKKKVIDKW